MGWANVPQALRTRRERDDVIERQIIARAGRRALNSLMFFGLGRPGARVIRQIRRHYDVYIELGIFTCSPSLSPPPKLPSSSQ